MAVAVVNRAMALVIYQFSDAFYFWLVWTLVLLAFAFLVHRGLAAREITAAAA